MDINVLQKNIAIDRSEQSYRKLFLHFYARILRFANVYVRQREVAEEIVSDVMIKLWTMEGRLLEITNLNVYLYTAVKNAAVNYLIKNKRYTSWDIDKIAPLDVIGAATPESLVLERELRDKIKHAIRQ